MKTKNSKQTSLSNNKFSLIFDSINLVIALFFFAFGVLTVILGWSQDIFHRKWVLFFTVVIMLFCIFAVKEKKRSAKKLRKLKKALNLISDKITDKMRIAFRACFWVILVLWQLLLVFATSSSEVTNDAHMLRVYATGAHFPFEETDPSGFAGEGGASRYFSIFPNNSIYVIIYSIIGNVSKVTSLPFWGIAGVINVIIIDFSLLFLFFVQKQITPRRKKVGLILFVLCFASTPYVRVLYSDSLALFFVSLFLFALFVQLIPNLKNLIDNGKTQKNRTICLSLILIAISLSFGFLAKPTVLILLIAVFMVIIFKVQKINLFKKLFANSNKTRNLQIFISLIVSFFLFTVPLLNGYSFFMSLLPGRIEGVTAESISSWEQTSFTPEHFILMSMQPSSPPTQYYYDPILQFSRSLPNKTERTQKTVEKIKETLSSQTFLEWVDFFRDKLAFNLGDGTFTYYFFSTSEAKRMLDVDASTYPVTGFVDSTTHFYQTYYKSFLQAIWLLVLLLSACFCASRLTRIVRSKRGVSATESILLLSFSGLQLFLLIFEAKPRYEILFLPIFCILATLGFAQLLKLRDFFRSRSDNSGNKLW